MKRSTPTYLRRCFLLTIAAVLLQGCSEPEQGAAAPAGETAQQPASPPVAAADFAFVNVNVISMVSDAVMPGQTVLIENGAIKSIVASDSIQLAAGTPAVDGTGRYLMPALTDMHDHVMGQESLNLQVAWGVTTVRNMFGSPETLKARDAIARGDMFGPEIITGSPLIDADPPYFPGSTILAKPEDADALVADLKAQGYSFLKPYELIKKDAYIAMVKAAERHGMTVEGHIPQDVSAELAVELGQKSIEHGMRIDAAILADGIPWSGSFRTREMIDLIARIDAGELTYEEAFSRDKLRDWSRLAAAKGTAVVPTMAVVQGRAWSTADRERIARHPQFKYLSPMFKPMWLNAMSSGGRDMSGKGVLLDVTDAEADSLKYFSSVEFGQWVGIMHDEGVMLLGGVDAANPGMFYGYSLHDEVRLMVELAHLSAFEALQTVTVNPAKYWGIEGQRGVVKAGAEADLLLLDANPLDNIANTRAIEGVMMNGAWMDRAALDDLLRSVEETYAAMAANPPQAPAGSEAK